MQGKHRRQLCDKEGPRMAKACLLRYCMVQLLQTTSGLQLQLREGSILILWSGLAELNGYFLACLDLP